MKLEFNYYQLENYIWGVSGTTTDPREEDEEDEPPEGWTGSIEADTESKMLHKLSGLIEQLVQAALLVGGDDEYFDYYPDNFYVLDQLVGQLNNEHLTDMVERARQWAVDVRYGDLEPETLGGDTEKYMMMRDPENIVLGDKVRELRANIMWRGYAKAD